MAPPCLLGGVLLECGRQCRSLLVERHPVAGGEYPSIRVAGNFGGEQRDPPAVLVRDLEEDGCAGNEVVEGPGEHTPPPSEAVVTLKGGRIGNEKVGSTDELLQHFALASGKRLVRVAVKYRQLIVDAVARCVAVGNDSGIG